MRIPIDSATLLLVGSTIFGFLAVILETGVSLFHNWAWRWSYLTTVGTSVAMFLGALLVGYAYAGLFRPVFEAVLRVAPSGLVSLWSAHSLMGFLFCFVAWDLMGFVYHWLGHRTSIGWAAHQPHHTGNQFDISLGLRQSWLPVFALPTQASVALLGFNFTTVAAVSAVSNLWQLLQHSRLLPRLPALIEHAVMTPSTHVLHHLYPGSNLGPVLTIWDRAAGSWVGPASREPIGCVTLPPSRSGVLRIEFGGWIQLITGSRRTVS
jgi:alkylglycerol monooxygenase